MCGKSLSYGNVETIKPDFTEDDGRKQTDFRMTRKNELEYIIRMGLLESTR